LRFTEKHALILKYVAEWGKWLLWNSSHWQEENTLKAYDLARHICREASAEIMSWEKPNIKLASAVAGASTVAAVERLARADRAFAVTAAIWDKDLFLLGTPGGTVELRTGKLRPAQQSDYITKSTLIAPAETAQCPKWLKFLNEATRGDTEYIRFLQQWCGYSLTGVTREQALVFIFGEGGNGKGTFLITVRKIFADYAAVAAMETFTASKTERHPTDLAMLRGARLVYVSETEQGKSWNEKRIKDLTGGDPISARFMHRDFFEYTPQFKITVIGNHKPIVQNVDDAIKRRLNLAPFVFKPPVPDQMLPEKLEEEYPGILRWMIDGALDWQQNGLIRPDVVRTATARYFADQDTVRQWVEDCCEVSARPPHVVDTNASLFASWRNYAAAHGELPGSSSGLADKLRMLGFDSVKDEGGIRGRGFIGIKVRIYSRLLYSIFPTLNHSAILHEQNMSFCDEFATNATIATQFPI